MAYTIKPSENGKYIIIEFSGEINRKIAMEANIESHALGKKRGISKYLTDLTNTVNTDTVIDNYSFAYEDMKIPNIDRSACVAVLVSPEDHSHDFIEILSRNAGLDVTIFRDKKEALEHLLNN